MVERKKKEEVGERENILTKLSFNKFIKSNSLERREKVQQKWL